MDLHRLVREVADNHKDVADPGKLAEFVFNALQPEDYEGAVWTMLRSYVRDVIRQQRNAPEPAPVRVKDLVGSTPQAFRPSSKVTGIRETWRRHLGDRVSVRDHDWKFLRDCTYEDLTSAADERRRLAAENTASARRYEKMAVALSEHDASTIGDLPENVLRELLS